MVAREIEPGDLGSSIALNRKAHLVKHWELHPPVVGTVAAGPDHGANAFLARAELDPGRDSERLHGIKIRQGQTATGAESFDGLPQGPDPGRTEDGDPRRP